jgi:hypothetical protein
MLEKALVVNNVFVFQAILLNSGFSYFASRGIKLISVNGTIEPGFQQAVNYWTSISCPKFRNGCWKGAGINHHLFQALGVELGLFRAEENVVGRVGSSGILDA